MPLLNIGKKKGAEATDAAQQTAVPEELPDLPADAPATPDQSQAMNSSDAAPAELPDIQQDLAPDELPPMTPGEVQDGSAALGMPGQSGQSLPSGDRKLYFSSMLQKLHQDGLKSTRLTASSLNVLADMKKHWKDTRKEEELASMERQVEDKILPLQRLEQEWVALKDDIELKRQQMHEKEEEIRRLSEELRTLAVKTEKMGSAKK
ncbi:hypothetical protein KY362_07115 [Candidatus Woesearchaeota archaeon]|nr:hypothetical protein [Candidatus Woesearchaeota archaeon]